MRVGFEGLLVNAGEGDTRHGFKVFRLRGEGGRWERTKRGLTDYILLVLARKVIHSYHSFLTATPPNVHSHHSGGANPRDKRGAGSHVTSSPSHVYLTLTRSRGYSFFFFFLNLRYISRNSYLLQIVQDAAG